MDSGRNAVVQRQSFSKSGISQPTARNQHDGFEKESVGFAGADVQSNRRRPDPNDGHQNCVVVDDDDDDDDDDDRPSVRRIAQEIGQRMFGARQSTRAQRQSVGVRRLFARSQQQSRRAAAAATAGLIGQRRGSVAAQCSPSDSEDGQHQKGV